MYEVMVEEHFSAAHYLRGYNGKCSQLHGHNWKVQVFLTGNTLNDMGMIIDFQELKKLLNIILDRLDHFCLNDLDIFAKVNPTSENIAYFIFHELTKKSLPGKISRVVVWESKSVCAAYDGK